MYPLQFRYLPLLSTGLMLDRNWEISIRCICHMQDDVNLFDYNVEDRVNDFVAAALAQV